jgi:hypothetical protein
MTMNLLRTSCLLFIGFVLLAAIEQVSVLEMAENAIVQKKMVTMGAQYQNW